jgi:flagellar biosynthesis protein FliR
MPDSLTLSAGTLYGFLLVLARVGGALVFVPLPGIRAAPEPVRAALAVAFTLALFGRWPAIDPTGVTAGTLAAWAISEAAFGIAIGISVAIVLEAFSMAAQAIGLQAGYAYASTIDPNSEADSGVLLVLAQLIAGMLFFTLGLDREVLRLFAASLEKIPAGAYSLGPAIAEGVIKLGSTLFSVGMRLALPIIALLVMVDVALALMGRLNQQLQLLSLAFPVKMLVSLLMLSWLAVIFPRMMTAHSEQVWTAIHRIFGI